MKLTVEDRRMVVYFIQAKGDITRWSQYEDKKRLIAAELPDLWHALQKQAYWDRQVKVQVDALERAVGD